MAPQAAATPPASPDRAAKAEWGRKGQMAERKGSTQKGQKTQEAQAEAEMKIEGPTDKRKDGEMCG